MKKFLQNILLIFSLAAAALLIRGSFKTARYNDCLADETAYLSIISARTPAEDLIEKIYFDETALIFDDSADLFYWSLAQNSSDAANPRIKLQSPYDVQIAFLNGKITDDSLRNNQTVKFVIYTNTAYCCYGLKCTTLPLMNVMCAGDIGASDIPMTMELLDNGYGIVSYSAYEGKIRVRGASTADYPKKGYRLSLTAKSVGNHVRKNKISLLGMRQDDDWLLYAAYNDAEKIRNVFSQNLWEYSCAFDNERRVNTGTEYKYLELFVNGRYAGLYALGYPIDEKGLELNGSAEGNALFKKVWRVSESSADFFGGNTGYELKTKYGAGKQKLLYDYYYKLAKNADKTDVLYKGIDIDNAIDFLLFCNLIQSLDNVDGADTKNLYLSLTESGGSLKGLYCPWDLDITWGNSWKTDAENYTVQYGIGAERNRIDESGYLNQIILNNDSDIWESIFDKYRKLRSGKWSNAAIDKLLCAYESQIYASGAYRRDKERWPNGSYADPSCGLSAFRSYVSQRLKEADEYYVRLKKVCRSGVYMRRIAQYKNFLNADFVMEISDRSLLEDADYASLLEYMGVDIDKITADIRFVLTNPSKNQYEYLPSIGAENDTTQTILGEISNYRDKNADYADESSFTVHLNGRALFTVSPYDGNANKTVLVCGENVYNMNLKSDFTIEWAKEYEKKT